MFSVANFTRAGFRAVLARPAIILAEIAWRWAFGAAAWTLIVVAIHRIFARIDVSQVESLLARHSDLVLVADACARVLSQVLPRLAAEALVLVPAMAVLWILAATVGRVVTLNSLISVPSRGYTRVLLLHIIRAALTIATVLATLGAIFLIGMTLAVQHMAAAIALSLVVEILILTCWSAVNWFVALAPIWIVRDGQGVFAAIGNSLDLYRRSATGYLGIASSFGIVRFVALVAATLVALIAAQSSPASAVAATIAVALGYFAVADFLYIARLAAYVELDNSSQQGSQPSAISSQPIPSGPASVSADEIAPQSTPEIPPLSSS